MNWTEYWWRINYSTHIIFILSGHCLDIDLCLFLELQIYKNNITQTNILLKFKFIKTNKADYDNRQAYAWNKKKQIPDRKWREYSLPKYLSPSFMQAALHILEYCCFLNSFYCHFSQHLTLWMQRYITCICLYRRRIFRKVAVMLLYFYFFW